MPVNVEIKARCTNPQRVKDVLTASGARRVGLDHQIDTYFVVADGRLKLRQGNIETNLIHYRRMDGAAPKTSEVSLYQPSDPDRLRILLSRALGIGAVVDKHREIFFHGNVKFHVDRVEGLGSFVEIEVIADVDPSDQSPVSAVGADETAMREVCTEWMDRLGISQGDLVARSYSDMIDRAT